MLKLKKYLTLKQIQESDNIANLLDPSDLDQIGQQIIKGYEIDEESRSEWREIVMKAMDITKQKNEPKNHPWPNSSNIKLPIITKAAINYSARTMPAIIQNNKVVKCSIEGKDLKGEKLKRANRVSDYMSYQLCEKMKGWKRGTDKLLQTLAVTGMAFKKTYYDPIDEEVCSEFCLPERICINHNAQSLHKASRITHIIELSQNAIIERQLAGIYCEDVSLDSLRSTDIDLPQYEEDTYNPNVQDDDYPVFLLEQHCFLDLDGDNYREPYIVTVHKSTGKVLRIYNRIKEIEKNDNDEVKRIIAEHYFTDYHFLNNPDGGFYSIGFGTLLLHLNTISNTLANQLIDSGTLSNMSTGLISRGVRLKNGEFKIKMGEYIPVDAASTLDLSKAIYTLPFKEPSDVLFKMLEMILKMCDDLTSVNDMAQGSQNATNVASSTVNQLVEQSTKVFAAINERVYESLKSEYEKIYSLNYKYLDNKFYKSILDDNEASVKKDFSENDLHIYPIADPAMSTISQRLTKASAIMSLRTVNPRAADLYVANSLQLDDSQINQLLPPPDPNAKPSLEDQKTMSEISLNQANAAKLAGDSQIDQQRLQLDSLKEQREQTWSNAQIQESATRNWKMQKDAVNNDIKAAIVQKKMETEQLIKAAHINLEAQKNKNDAILKAASTNNGALKDMADTHVDLAKIFNDNQKNVNPEDQENTNEEEV